MKSCVPIEFKSNEQYYAVPLLIILCKVVITFESVDGILYLLVCAKPGQESFLTLQSVHLYYLFTSEILAH